MSKMSNWRFEPCIERSRLRHRPFLPITLDRRRFFIFVGLLPKLSTPLGTIEIESRGRYSLEIDLPLCLLSTTLLKSLNLSTMRLSERKGKTSQA